MLPLERVVAVLLLGDDRLRLRARRFQPTPGLLHLHGEHPVLREQSLAVEGQAGERALLLRLQRRHRDLAVFDLILEQRVGLRQRSGGLLGGEARRLGRLKASRELIVAFGNHAAPALSLAYRGLALLQLGRQPRVLLVKRLELSLRLRQLRVLGLELSLERRVGG